MRHFFGTVFMNVKFLIFGYSTSFEVDENTLKTIKSMRQRFGVRRPAQVIVKALALAKVCADHADDDGIVRFLNPNGSIINVNLKN